MKLCSSQSPTGFPLLTLPPGKAFVFPSNFRSCYTILDIERVRAPIARIPPKLSEVRELPAILLSYLIGWFQTSRGWKKPTNQLHMATAQVQRVGGVIGTDHNAHNKTSPHVWHSARDGISTNTSRIHDLIHAEIQRPICNLTCKQTSSNTCFIA